MSQKISVKKTVENQTLRCDISIYDSSLLGKKVFVYLKSRVRVKDSRPVNNEIIHESQKFTIQYGEIVAYFDIGKYQAYSYKGVKIDIDFFVSCSLGDAIIFNTKIESKIQNTLGVRPKVGGIAKEILDPKDMFSFIKNIKAIPLGAKIAMLGLSLIACILVTINMAIGVHDQFSPEAQTIFYSHYDGDGDSSSPLFNALAGSGALGGFVWVMIKKQLRGYMTFFFRKHFRVRERDISYSVAEIVGGVSQVDLYDTTLRIVAGNLELGQYKRGSGTKTRIVSFSNPARAVTLYSQKIDFIPKGVDISSYITGEVSFEEMYRVLYPHSMISKTHGLKVHFEIQLIHDDYIDQELIGKSEMFPYKYFLEA